MSRWRPLRNTDWEQPLTERLPSGYWEELGTFLRVERSAWSIFPVEEDVFRAFRETPRAETRVVILGQDPYPTTGDADGLAFSIPRGRPLTPTLKNIHAELACDGFGPTPTHGSLGTWPGEGVLLLNAALTVRQEHRRSHRRMWREFTNAVLEIADEGETVFMLWGRDAERAAKGYGLGRAVKSAHPSPLSARRGFLDSHPFTRTNVLLTELGRTPVNWVLPD